TNFGVTSVTYQLPTGCSMTTNVTVNPLTNFVVNACVGASCLPTQYVFAGSPSTIHIVLNGSTIGVNYTLMFGGFGITTMPGTGGPLDFGIQSAGGTYTVFATNTTTGCSRNMVSSGTIVISPLPADQVLYGGGSYCAGTTPPHINIWGSQVGVDSLLYTGTYPTGTYDTTVHGTGGALDFGTWGTPGIYTIHARYAG